MQWINAKQVRQKISSKYSNEENKEFWRQILAASSHLFLARHLGKRVDKQLTEADIPLRGEEFVVIIAAAGLAAGAFFTVLTLNIRIGCTACITASLLPFLLLRTAYARRLNAFNSQIGDALAVIANSLRSGFSFLQAMDMVRKELPNPIRKEFSRTFQEINLGTSTEDALQNMANRVNSEDMELVVTSVLIQRQVGGNLAEVLDNIGNTIRERIRIKREIKTITAQGRISGLIIGLMPVALALLMMVINPDYIMILLTTTQGHIMLFTAVFGELLGVLLIKKIVNIQV
ncbi:MAG: type II secretion system F family protein [Clostridiales bacterium]|nr:type II secretion system F family protein [Clostridiales bacterium]MCF8023055.1 type II secretion system F family protein [Clostridiales bacterium]